jgi:hypothetical protein
MLPLPLEDIDQVVETPAPTSAACHYSVVDRARSIVAWTAPIAAAVTAATRPESSRRAIESND